MIYKIGDVVEFRSLFHKGAMEGRIEWTDDEFGAIVVKNTENGEPALLKVEDVVLVKGAALEEKPAESKYHDAHYASLQVQPIELMQACMTPVEFKGFLRGNIIKYSLRAGMKVGESLQKDMDKASRYREWLLMAEANLKINPAE